VDVSSSDPEGLARAIQMISDITAVPEIGKTYLGKVVRLAEFGAFVEIFPGTDGLLHVSEIAEHRVKEVKDELREGDTVLVKVLGIEGNRIKLSRKAVLKEQRAKLGLPDPEPQADDRGARPERSEQPRAPRPERTAPPPSEETITLEGGDDFDDEEDDDLEDGDEDGDEPETTTAEGDAPAGGAPRPAGAANKRRRRRGGRRGGPGGAAPAAPRA
jgi:polyribonucleotide nucleotidyltransferase